MPRQVLANRDLRIHAIPVLRSHRRLRLAPTLAPVRCGVVSFRLGGTDGVSIEAAKWMWALGTLGYDVKTIAGSGPVDVVLPGLGIGEQTPPTLDEFRTAIDDCDLIVVENLCSLPLNPAASEVVSRALRGRPALLHHHDLPWQRAHLSHFPPPPTDPMWRHVTINELSRHELAVRGIGATTIYNTFDPEPPLGRREELRCALGVSTNEMVILQPTRALLRKNIQAGFELATEIGGTYWLLGPPEDGYGPTLDVLIAAARCPVRRGLPLEGATIHDAYAACDLVALPSSWEGFGNPTVESATHRRPLAVGRYRVAHELEAFGFEWFDAFDPPAVAKGIETVDAAFLEHNHAVAARHFNLGDLPRRIEPLLIER